MTEIGVKRWQHDFWLKIIQAALDGHPDQVGLIGIPACLNRQRSGIASSPHLLGWLDQWNAERPYEDRIKPFGFLLSYMPRTGI
ncbi:MAG: hypothetical protein U5K38_12895 [Woeseiaceae bacterium]|nr:hypothetical protein [Woeseiaceae bacterium]